MVEAAPRAGGRAPDSLVTHQTGERDLEMVRDGYRGAGLAARVEPFLYAMDREMKAADLIVCRAGATTLAEITAAGRPAVLVPLPTATDDHQRKNADVLRAAGAAEVIDQRELTGERLAARVLALAGDRARRAAHGARRRARWRGRTRRARSSTGRWRWRGERAGRSGCLDCRCSGGRGDAFRRSGRQRNERRSRSCCSLGYRRERLGREASAVTGRLARLGSARSTTGTTRRTSARPMSWSSRRPCGRQPRGRRGAAPRRSR